MRRWFNAAALVRPAADGGLVVITADDAAAVGALLRWDPPAMPGGSWTCAQELQLPPAVRIASVTGGRTAVGHFSAAVEQRLGAQAIVLRTAGPAPLVRPRRLATGPCGPPANAAGEDVRTLLFFPYAQAAAATGCCGQPRPPLPPSAPRNRCRSGSTASTSCSAACARFTGTASSAPERRGHNVVRLRPRSSPGGFVPAESAARATERPRNVLPVRVVPQCLHGRGESRGVSPGRHTRRRRRPLRGRSECRWQSPVCPGTWLPPAAARSLRRGRG